MKQGDQVKLSMSMADSGVDEAIHFQFVNPETDELVRVGIPKEKFGDLITGVIGVPATITRYVPPQETN